MTVAKVWDGTQWIPIIGAQGPKGDPGADGAPGTPTWRGVWQDFATYKAYEAVSYQGQSWVSNQAATGAGGAEPGGSLGLWDLMAAQGATGPAGGTMGAAGYHSTANGATVSVANVWKTLPLGANPTVDPVGMFVQNADNSVTIVETGWYTFQAFAVFNTAGISGAVGLSTVTNSAPNIGSPGAGAAGVSWGPNSVLSDSFKVTAGTKIYAVAVTSSSTNIVSFLTNLSIVRVGGPQGQMEVYQQPDEPPATAKTGAIWVDTDAPIPTGGNVPAGGTTGQVLTKTGSTDFSANWQTLPVPSPVKQTYSVNATVAVRSLNVAAGTNLNEVANVLAMLIYDMQNAGLIKP